MNKLSKNIHLSKEDIIKNGSIFTPDYIVKLVYNMVNKYIDKDTVIADFCSGYGAFLQKFKNKGRLCIGTEFDYKSYEFLMQNFRDVSLFYENSLLDVKRDKYDINVNDRLIVVGNPPYNDITSIYKKGEKGSLECDSDLLSRDMGISFLKAYCKLGADYICVLHPLSYLIKRQNFNMLGDFHHKYRLINGVVFSSKEFESIKKSNSDFPVVAALYEKNNLGMDFEYINTFSFKIFNSRKRFCLGKISTIDGKIQKYPQKSNKVELQFYTLRDMNALIRNTSFIVGPRNNGITVTIDNLYQYAWLYFLKENFNPQKNKFLYGNLSPLYFDKLEYEDYKNLVVSYAYNNCRILSDFFSKEELENKYGSMVTNYELLYDMLNKLYIFE